MKRMNRPKVICVVDMRLVCKTIAPQNLSALTCVALIFAPPLNVKLLTPNLKPVKMSEE
jgi:hypothetical protein